MHDDGEDVVQAVLTAAKGGDMVAARLVLERILPARRGRPVVFALPPVKSAGDLPHALAAVVAAVAAGNLTPEEGQAVAAMLEVQRRGIELADHERVFRLLGVTEAIGVTLTESYQMVPEQSTAAIIVPHPDSVYFAVRP